VIRIEEAEGLIFFQSAIVAESRGLLVVQFKKKFFPSLFFMTASNLQLRFVVGHPHTYVQPQPPASRFSAQDFL